MENDSLQVLKHLIEEEIYLIPEDRKAILAQLEDPTPTAAKPIGQAAKVGVIIPKQEISESVSEPIATYQSPGEAVSYDPIQVRGQFTKGLLVLHEEEKLSSEVMEMLVKMINACGHSMNEVGLLSSEKLEGRTVDEFKNLNAHTVLKFGRINHPINAFPARTYEVHSEKGTEYLFADSLSSIAEDKKLKIKLWTSLQALFNLKSTK